MIIGKITHNTNRPGDQMAQFVLVESSEEAGWKVSRRTDLQVAWFLHTSECQSGDSLT